MWKIKNDETNFLIVKMPVLTTQQRNTLESAVKQARKLAETGARNALHALAVDNPEPFAHM